MQSQPEININDIIDSHSLLKRATIKVITDYVLKKVKSTGLIELASDHEETVYLHVDKSLGEIDFLSQPKVGEAQLLPITTYNIEELFNFYHMIVKHPLKSIKRKISLNSELN